MGASNLTITPLTWPAAGDASWSSWLKGGLFSPRPGWGHICNQLKSREPLRTAIEEPWSTHTHIDRGLRAKACTLIMTCIGWPNDLYIPADPLAILLLDPSPDMRDAEVLQELETLLKKPIVFNLETTLCELFD